jgi:hypothetical protein
LPSMIPGPIVVDRQLDIAHAKAKGNLE